MEQFAQDSLLINHLTAVKVETEELSVTALFVDISQAIKLSALS